MKKYFGGKEVWDAVAQLENDGYEILSVPGSLLDSYICVAPDENHWNYIFREEYLNESSSAYSFRRCGKISKATWKWYEKSLAWWDRAD